MGELIDLGDVRGWTPKGRAELLLEWRLIGEQLAIGELAALVAAPPPARPERPDAVVLPYASRASERTG